MLWIIEKTSDEKELVQSIIKKSANNEKLQVINYILFMN